MSEEENKLAEVNLIPEDDEATIAFRQAAELLGKAASDRTNRNTYLKDAESALGKIRIIDYPELAESPIIQNFVKAMGMSGLQPGEVKNKGTLAEREREWTMHDVRVAVARGIFKLRTFTPNENLTLVWNGVEIQIIANEECTLPDVFHDVYRERQEALRQGRLHVEWLMGRSSQQPNINWVTPEGAIVRAWSKQGEALGLVSGFLGVGPIDTSSIPAVETKE